MFECSPLGFGNVSLPPQGGDRTEYIVVQQPLRRVLAFIGRSIDDVVNNPIAKNEVLGYFKLYKQIARAAEVHDLEHQWNPMGRRS